MKEERGKAGNRLGFADEEFNILRLTPSSLPYDDPDTEDIDESKNWKFLKTIRWNGKGTRYDIPQFTVSGNFGGKSNNGRVVLVRVDITEVISDQIAGNDANKLPTEFFVGEPNNPMLMATRSGQKAKLRVKVAAVNDLFYVGARKIGTQKILGFAPVTNKEVKLEFNVPKKSHAIYEIVAGVDVNQNQKLDDSEAISLFEKTPGGSGQYWDRIIIVDEDQFEDSQDAVIGYNVIGSEYAGDLVEAFGRGSKAVDNARREDQVMISSTEPGLSHPVGSKWNAANKDTTYRFVFDDGDPASEDVDDSKALKQIVEKMITTHKAAMLAAYTGTPEWLVSPYYNFDESKNLIITENELIGINELGNAFGKVDFKGKVRFRYKKIGGKIRVGSAEVIGSFSDLYDFAYGGGPGRARQASLVQAGHASLAGGNNGKVFFTHLKFDSGWSKKWNGDY